MHRAKGDRLVCASMLPVRQWPGYGKIYFAFLIHVANEIQLSSIYLLIACSELRKIFLRIEFERKDSKTTLEALRSFSWKNLCPGFCVKRQKSALTSGSTEAERRHVGQLFEDHWLVKLKENC